MLTYSHKTARRTGQPRLIALTDRQLRFFRNLRRQRVPGLDHVFLNTECRPWSKNTFGQHLRQTAERMGLDDKAVAAKVKNVSGYCFRHSLATKADEAGCAGVDTAMLLGHKGERMSRTVYSKASRKVKDVRGAAVRMERMRREARRRLVPADPATHDRAAPPAAAVVGERLRFVRGRRGAMLWSVS